MSDLVARLRGRVKQEYIRGTGDRFYARAWVPDELCQEAADEIQRLQGTLKALRQCREVMAQGGIPLSAWKAAIAAADAALRAAGVEVTHE